DSNLLVPKVIYDFDIHSDFLTFDLLDFFEKMEPFGNGNQKPQFVLKNAMLENFKYMGADSKHISFNLRGKDIRCIYFDGAKILKNLNTNDTYDILFAFEKNEYRDNVYMQIMVKAIRNSE
ncbi:hypothetical protein KA001_00585, partial [Patescibacteria group bacterium]|nr:hypothetical protein [Patescibacteria group bacterium]